jgi:hypothetical protein
MGIKFLCPNGHKLNVKSFLAGKRAICPKCGVALTVPLSDRDNLPEQEAGTSAILTENDLIGLGLMTPGEATAPATAIPANAATSAVARAGAAAAATASAAPSDPIAEAPSAVWYVRPSSGGQFGPASGDMMRAWINEGRVGGSSLVWRAGWPDWRSAAATFPQLSASMPAPTVTAPVQAVVPVGSPVTAVNGHDALPLGQLSDVGGFHAPSALPAGSGGNVPPLVLPGKRRNKNDPNLIASMILVGVSIILVIVLLFVFWHNSDGSGDEAKSSASESKEIAPAKEPSME